MTAAQCRVPAGHGTPAIRTGAIILQARGQLFGNGHLVPQLGMS